MLNKIKNIDYVICPICFQKMNKITWRHLRKHNLTTKEFKESFPCQETICTKTREKYKSLGMLNKKHSESTKQKNRDSHIGRKHTKKTKKKMSELKVGKKFTKEHKRKISESQKGKIMSRESVEKSRLGNIGKKVSLKTKKKISKFHKGKKTSNETKRKMRKTAVKRILLNNGKFPSYNLKAVEFFKSYDKENNTNGQYATHPNEYYIKELGYFPDYINFKKKLIMEYDEKQHFDKEENLKEKDIIRQKEIQEKYPDFKFLRFKDIEMDKILYMEEK